MGRRSDVAVHVAERGAPRKPPWGSAKAGGLQVIIGRNDLPQPVEAAIPAIGIRVMPLHQHLEPHLNVGPLGVGFKAEHVERAPLRIDEILRLSGALRA